MEQPRAKSGSQTATVWMCYGAMMCLAIAVNLTPVYLTTFGEAFGGKAGLSEEQLGRIPGLTFLSLTLAVILCGPLADRFGGKLFSILGLALVLSFPYYFALETFFSHDDFVILWFHKDLSIWQPWQFLDVEVLTFYRPTQSYVMAVLFHFFGLACRLAPRFVHIDMAGGASASNTGFHPGFL